MRERESFLVWRRDLASLEEMEGVITITPFEKNLEVWRQLWRVLERSDLVRSPPGEQQRPATRSHRLAPCRPCTEADHMLVCLSKQLLLVMLPTAAGS